MPKAYVRRQSPVIIRSGQLRIHSVRRTLNGVARVETIGGSQFWFFQLESDREKFKTKYGWLKETNSCVT